MPAARHAGREGKMHDVSEASGHQLGTLQVLLPDELHKAAHEDAVQVCLWVLLPVLLCLLQLFCNICALGPASCTGVHACVLVSLLFFGSKLCQVTIL